MSRRETSLIVALGAVAFASLLTAVAAVTLALVVGRRDSTKIRTLERQVRVLCSRRTVAGVKLTAGGRARVTTSRGC
jgi:hypothetical protein